MASFTQRTTACRVELVTPDFVRLVFDSTTAQDALLSVTTTNDLGDPCGTFSLTFAPVTVQGRTYDQLIPMRSLVTIAMDAPVTPGTPASTVVMVGLTEDHAFVEDYSRGQPQRVVTISGRSMAGVFLDMALRHYPILEHTPDGVLTVGDKYFNLFIPTNFLSTELKPDDALRACLTYFLGLKSHKPITGLADHLTTQQAVQRQQAQHPGTPPRRQAQATMQETTSMPDAVPADAVTITSPGLSLEKQVEADKAVETYMATHPDATPGEIQAVYVSILRRAVGGGTVTTTPTRSRPRPKALAQAPIPATTAPAQEALVTSTNRNVLMNLQLPGRPLADLLDLNDHTWTLFDEGITMPVGIQNTPYALTLYHYLQQFVDPTFQEFFTRVEDGVVKVFFRAKPFLATTSFTGTRFAQTDPTCQTIAFSREEWEAQYLGAQLRRQMQNVHNTFLVVPLMAQPMLHQAGMEFLLAPVFLDDPAHPSFIGKYGLRELRADSPYMSLKKLGDPSPTEAQKAWVIRIAKAWSETAAGWYGLGSEMYAGVITVVGSSRWNCGHRLLYTDARGEREFYIEGISHSYTYRTGQYLTQLRVTRGYYLSGLTDERGPASGGVITTETFQEPEVPVNAP